MLQEGSIRLEMESIEKDALTRKKVVIKRLFGKADWMKSKRQKL